VIRADFLARSLDQVLGDQDWSWVNLEFAAQAFELAGPSQPFAFVDGRSSKLSRAVRHKFFEYLIACLVRVVAEAVCLIGFGRFIVSVMKLQRPAMLSRRAVPPSFTAVMIVLETTTSRSPTETALDGAGFTAV
jgi:hypothetical protein